MSNALILGIAAGMVVVGGGFIYLLIGRNPNRKPRDPVEWMATILSSLLVVSALLLMGVTLTTRPTGPPPANTTQLIDIKLNEPAPNFDFKLVSDDSPLDLEEYRGKVVLLNFWATWCAPCLVEIPELNELQKDLGSEGLVIVSISDEPRDELVDFQAITSMKTVSAYITDPQALPDRFRQMVTLRPMSFIIDRDGQMQRYLVGARNYSFFENAVRPFL